MTKILRLSWVVDGTARKLVPALSLAPLLAFASCKSSDASSTSCVPAAHDGGGHSGPDGGKPNVPKPDSGGTVPPDGGPVTGDAGAPMGSNDGGDGGAELPSFQPSNVPGGSVALPPGASPAVINSDCVIDTS